MKPSKPNIPPDLEFTPDLPSLMAWAREEELDIESRHFKDLTLNEADFSHLSFRSSLFENCDFSDCNFEKIDCRDLHFQSCSLSNCNFAEGYFNRCTFFACKLVGADFHQAQIENVLASESSFKYANFSKTRLKSSL